jgi:hypothetical protein
MTRIIPILAVLALAGCARSEEAALIAPDSNMGYNQVGSVGLPEDDDREPAIGQWRASLQENVQALEFGPMGTEPLFSLLCSGNSAVWLQRHGGAPAGPLPEMVVERGDVNERLPVTVTGGAVPMLRTEVQLTSPLAQSIAAQGEALVIILGDTAPLILPASPLIADYLRSCQTATPLPTSTSDAAATGNSAAPAPAGNTAAPAPAPAANSAQPKQ